MASSKPIQEQIYKSRLTITYRTTITGTLQEETLPFRLLVLGGFSGRSLRDAKLLDPLPQRHVRTIKRGRSVDDHLDEMVPVWRFPSDAMEKSKYPQLSGLVSYIPGKVKIESLQVTVPAGLSEQQEKQVPISGTVTFSSQSSENGFCDFDEQRLKVTGNVGVSKQGTGIKWGKAIVQIHDVALADRLDPATRTPTGKVVGVASMLQIGTAPIDVSAWTNDLVEERGDDGSAVDANGRPKPQQYKLTPTQATEYPVALERAVPFTSMASFSPDELAENIPEIERVRLLKRLLARLQSELRNRPDLRANLRSLLPGPDDKTPAAQQAKLDRFTKLRAWVDAHFPVLKLDLASSPTAATVDDAAVKQLQDDILKPINATSFDLYPPADASASSGANGDASAAAAPAEPWAIIRRITPATSATPAPSGDANAANAANGANGSTTANGSTALAAPLKFDDRELKISDAAWFMNGLAVFLANIDAAAAEVRRLDRKKPDPTTLFPDCLGSYPQFLNAMTALLSAIDRKVRGYLDAVYHHPDFQKLESLWRGLDDLASSVEANDVYIDFLDVGKDELRDDITDHDLDMFSGEIFNKVYVGEYDRYGGKPFAAMIGLYAYGSTQDDVRFLRAMGRVANAAHCPFVAAAAPDFFAPYKTMEEVAAISDLDAVLSEPQFGKWQELRDTEYAAYLGLTLPRYLVREPWKPETLGNDVGYTETVPFSHAEILGEDPIAHRDDAALKENLLWGHASVLFAKNMVASYQGSGWAQYIRGPRGGGLCEGLVSYKYNKNGYEEIQPPVEVAIPDYRELQFATNGFIPLVHKKGEAVATFFSAQSLKKPKKFVEDLATKNAALVTNLAYTFSITRIAHYVKRMMREYIGANAEGPYIQKVLAAWLGQYVTIVSNPDDLTLRYYPFKAATVDVQPKPGPLGWYKATIKILPHIQFEGMDVELQLEAALGGP